MDNIEFEGEDPRWVQCFLAALSGNPAVAAQERADKAVEILDERKHRRAARLAAQVRETGAYASRDGESIYDVTTAGLTWVTLTRRGASARDSRNVPLKAFADPDDLEGEHWLIAAPKASQAEVVARLKVAAVLGCPAQDVTLTWDGDEDDMYERPYVTDVEVRLASGETLRPTSATWQKLVDVGLPIYSYETARKSWSAS